MTVQITKDQTKRIAQIVKGLTTKQALVGITTDTATREDASPINNAQIAYIQEHGSPINNIPARPFLGPGIEKVKDKILTVLRVAAIKALDAEMDRSIVVNKNAKDGEEQLMSSSIYPINSDVADNALMEVGMIAVAGVQNYIVAGIPPGLADSTLLARARREGTSTGLSIAEGAKAELEYREKHPNAGASMTATTPLVDSSQLLHAITFVVRDK